MSSGPCDFSITSIHSAEEGDIIRVEAKDGLKTLVQIDIAPPDFTRCMLEKEVVIAAITMVKS